MTRAAIRAALAHNRGRLWAAAFSAASLAAAAPAHAFDPNNPAGSGYVETFSDNFQAINTAVWENDWWYHIGKQNACEKAYLPGTVLASAGGLDMHIESLETIPACQGVAKYSAAHLDSYNGFSQQYGYFEASIKSSGVGGTLTAFWLLPESGAWPPEVDAEEIRGDVPATAYLTNHFGKRNRQTQFLFNAPQSLGDAFHTYGVLLTAKDITWYIDGIRRGQTTRASDEATPMFVIFSLYTGNCHDGWAGCPKQKTGFSADAYVQWVRVWQGP